MEKTNTPNQIINALMPPAIKVAEGIEVKALSLAHYLLLEKIHSYLVENHEPKSDLEILESLFICTHSAKDVHMNFNDIEELSLEWAESLHPSMLKTISDAILEQIKIMSDVVPQGGPSKKKDMELTAG